jgi:alpha-galactosidase
VLQILDMQEGLRQYAGPDHWNDMDMLEVGNGMSVNEDRAHFSIWVMMASPLITGNDLRSMSKETAAILTNKAVIAISQDPKGVQAFRHSRQDDIEYWFKPLSNGDWAMMILNRNREAHAVSFDWAHEEVADKLSGALAGFGQVRYDIRDQWTGRAAGNTGKPLRANVPGHDVLLLRLTSKQKRPL